MTSGDRFEEHDKDTLEIVLREILQEQQKINEATLDQTVAIKELVLKVDSFNDRIDNLKIIAPPVSTKGFEQIFSKAILGLKLEANNNPKAGTKKFQILLFPEQDAKLFYKIVFGRWLVWLTILLLITNVYKFSVHWSDNQKEMKLRTLQTDRIKNAWNYLYLEDNKKVRQLMDSAFMKALK